MSRIFTKLSFAIAGPESDLAASSLEQAMNRVPGIIRVSVSAPRKFAKVECDETVISAQEIARWLSDAGDGNSGIPGLAKLVLKVPSLRGGDKALPIEAVLLAIGGVAGVTFRPELQAVEVAFHREGCATSADLIEGLRLQGVVANRL